MDAKELVRKLQDCGGGPEGIRICRAAADLIENQEAQLLQKTQRLAAYEDTGLTPREIEVMKKFCSNDNKIYENLMAENIKLSGQLAKLTEKPELTSPVKYYTEGKPYLQIGGIEMTDNPIVEACARLDRYEKYVIPHLQAQIETKLDTDKVLKDLIESLQVKLSASQRREQAAARDMGRATCHVCEKYRVTCSPRCDEVNGGCAGFIWRGPEEGGEG